MERTPNSNLRKCPQDSTEERLFSSRGSRKTLDLTIVFPGVKEIKVHRWTLSTRSPVFKAMMYGPWAEDGVITLKEDPPEAFEWVLEYLYKRNIKLPGIVMALQVYRLAHKYQVEELPEVCSEYLVEEVDYDTFPSVFDTALLLEDHKLLERCSEIVAVWSEKVLSSRELGGLRRSSLKKLLTHPRLNVTSETFVFLALVNWGLENLDLYEEKTSQQTSATQATPEVHPHVNGSQGIEPEPLTGGMEGKGVASATHKLRELLEEFLPLVRFLNMTVEELEECVVPSGIFTSNESAALIQRSRGGDTFVLPSFISHLAASRRESAIKTTTLPCPGSDSGPSRTSNSHNQITLNLLQKLRVDKPVLLVRIAATCIPSFSDGEVNVWDSANETVGKGIWQGVNCTFKRPLKLMTGKWYRVMVSRREALCSLAESLLSMVHLESTSTIQSPCNGKVIITYFVDSVAEGGDADFIYVTPS